MKPTTPATQAEISACLEDIFRDFVRTVSSPIISPETKLYSWANDLHRLRKCFLDAEERVDLGAAFETALQRTTAHEPQSEVIEAQLDVGRMGIRHLIELASGESLAKSRTAGSETRLRGAVQWLDKVRASDAPITKPDPADPSPVPASLTPRQAKAESDLAMEIAELFREMLRSISADDRRGPVVKVLAAFTACRNLANRIEHSFYFYSPLESAIDQFNSPEGLTQDDLSRLRLARAGIRLLATLTDPHVRFRGYASRRARDTRHFDAELAGLHEQVNPRSSGGS